MDHLAVTAQTAEGYAHALVKFYCHLKDTYNRLSMYDLSELVPYEGTTPEMSFL